VVGQEKFMLKTFYPDNTCASAYDIPYEALYARGIRALIFDIDNTLTEHGKPATDRAIALMERLKGIGFRICLLSNNKEERVKMFNEKMEEIENCPHATMKLYIPCDFPCPEYSILRKEKNN
jgi:predicted HAD superfamily phosphohydrolase YqeG